MSEAAEWRTRAIWDAIDAGSYKQAVQLCSKHLKKSPNTPIFQALAALATLKMGKTEEALKLCDAARQMGGASDPVVLPVLAQVYNQTGRRKEVSKMYETSYLANVRNEELGNLWFMSLVKDMSFKEQQQVALKFHKQFKSTKYLMWAAVAANLQATEEPGSSQLLYALAERLALKAWDEFEEPSLEATLFYLDLLVDQGKLSEAISFLETDKAAKSFRIPSHRLKLRADLLLKIGRTKEAQEQCWELLAVRDDDWEVWSILISAAEASESGGDSLEALRDLVAGKVEAASSDLKRIRPLMIAQLEVARRGNFQAQSAAAVEKYLNLFGSNYHTVGDVAPFVSTLSAEARDKMAATWKPAVDVAAEDIGRFTNAVKLQLLVSGLDSVTNESSNMLGDLWETYSKLQTSADAQHLDDLGLICGQICCHRWVSSGQLAHALMGIALLEKALETSPANFQIKLLLIRLWSALGGSTRVWDLFANLGIKHTLQDTLGYLLTDSFDFIASPEAISKLLSFTQSIYTSNETETPQMIIKAYENGSYTKVAEFRGFSRRLQNSLQRAIHCFIGFRVGFVKNSSSVQQLKAFCESNQPVLEHATSTPLSDNQDRQVISSWNTESAPNMEDLSRSTLRRTDEWVNLQRRLCVVLRDCLADAKSDMAQSVSELRNVLQGDDMGSKIEAADLEQGKVVLAVASFISGAVDAVAASGTIDSFNDNLQKAVSRMSFSTLWTARDLGWLVRGFETILITGAMLANAKASGAPKSAANGAVPDVSTAFDKWRSSLKEAIRTLKNAASQEPELSSMAGNNPAAEFAKSRSGDLIRRLRADYVALLADMNNQLR